MENKMDECQDNTRWIHLYTRQHLGMTLRQLSLGIINWHLVYRWTGKKLTIVRKII